MHKMTPCLQNSPEESLQVYSGQGKQKEHLSRISGCLAPLPQAIYRTRGATTQMEQLPDVNHSSLQIYKSESTATWTSIHFSVCLSVCVSSSCLLCSKM